METQVYSYTVEGKQLVDSRYKITCQFLMLQFNQEKWFCDPLENKTTEKENSQKYT